MEAPSLDLLRGKAQAIMEGNIARSGSRAAVGSTSPSPGSAYDSEHHGGIGAGAGAGGVDQGLSSNRGSVVSTAQAARYDVWGFLIDNEDMSAVRCSFLNGILH